GAKNNQHDLREKVLDLTREGREEDARYLRDLLFKKFVYDDLRTLCSSSQSKGFEFGDKQNPEDHNSGDRFQDYFLDYTWARYQTELKADIGAMSLDEYMDFRRVFAQVKAPLYIIFTEDDPIQ